jgi:hypothetical protein
MQDVRKAKDIRRLLYILDIRLSLIISILKLKFNGNNYNDFIRIIAIFPSSVVVPPYTSFRFLTVQLGVELI